MVVEILKLTIDFAKEYKKTSVFILLFLITNFFPSVVVLYFYDKDLFIDFDIFKMLLLLMSCGISLFIMCLPLGYMASKFESIIANEFSFQDKFFVTNLLSGYISAVILLSTLPAKFFIKDTSFDDVFEIVCCSYLFSFAFLIILKLMQKPIRWILGWIKKTIEKLVKFFMDKMKEKKIQKEEIKECKESKDLDTSD